MTYHFINSVDVHVVPKSTVSNAAYTLLLTGKKLSLSVLNNQRKYRARGNLKEGLQAFNDLDAAGLGTIDVKEMHRGTAKVRWQFHQYNYAVFFAHACFSVIICVYPFNIGLLLLIALYRRRLQICNF